MSNIVNDHKSIVKFANEFYLLTGHDLFVPCYADKKTGKKPQCKGVDLNNRYTPGDLVNYPSMTSLGLLLSDRFIALDCDGVGAIETLKQLEKDYGKLPPTLHVSSTPGERQALIFELPEDYIGKVKFQTLLNKLNNHKLEIRTGKQYQIICGLHPKGENYQHLTDIIKPAMMPIMWCEGLIALSGNDEPEPKNGNGNGNGKVTFDLKASLNEPEQIENDLLIAESLIEFLLLLGDSRVNLDERNNRVRLGGIIKSIDSNDAGLELFDRICQKHYTYDLQKTIDCWKGLKAEGATLGSLKYWFTDAFNVAEKSNDSQTKQIVEDARKTYKKIANPYQQSVNDFFHYLKEKVNYDACDIDEELLNYCQVNKFSYTLIIQLWEEFYKQNSINIAKQINALNAIGDYKKCDANAIFRMIPGGEIILDKLIAKKVDSFKGLLVYLTCAISTRHKERKAIFMGNMPVSSNLFTVINADTSSNKSILLNIFTTALKELDKVAQNRNTELLRLYEEWLEIWADTPKKERGNLLIPEVLGGKTIEEKLADQANSGSAEFNADGTQVQPIQIKPKPPKQENEYIVSRSTPEYIDELNSVQTHGSLWLSGELINILQSAKGYGANASNQMEVFARLIDMYDGAYYKSGRVSKKNIHGIYGTSLLSAIQPDALVKYASLNDPQGFIGRINFIDGKGLEYEETDPNEEHEILDSCDSLLMAQYQCIHGLEPRYLKPTTEGFNIWKAFRREIMTMIKQYPNLKVGYIYSLNKIAENVAKFAGILHDLKHQNNEEITIDNETVLAAVSIGYQLIADHARLFDAYTVDEEVDVELLEHHRFIIDYLAKRDKPAQLKSFTDHRYFKDKKMKSKEVKPLLDFLVGKKIDFVPGEGYRIIK